MCDGVYKGKKGEEKKLQQQQSKNGKGKNVQWCEKSVSATKRSVHFKLLAWSTPKLPHPLRSLSYLSSTTPSEPLQGWMKYSTFVCRWFIEFNFILLRAPHTKWRLPSLHMRGPVSSTHKLPSTRLHTHMYILATEEVRNHRLKSWFVLLRLSSRPTESTSESV